MGFWARLRRGFGICLLMRAPQATPRQSGLGTGQEIPDAARLGAAAEQAKPEPHEYVDRRPQVGKRLRHHPLDGGVREGPFQPSLPKPSPVA